MSVPQRTTDDILPSGQPVHLRANETTTAINREHRSLDETEGGDTTPAMSTTSVTPAPRLARGSSSQAVPTPVIPTGHINPTNMNEPEQFFSVQRGGGGSIGTTNPPPGMAMTTNIGTPTLSGMFAVQPQQQPSRSIHAHQQQQQQFDLTTLALSTGLPSPFMASPSLMTPQQVSPQPFPGQLFTTNHGTTLMSSGNSAASNGASPWGSFVAPPSIPSTQFFSPPPSSPYLYSHPSSLYPPPSSSTTNPQQQKLSPLIQQSIYGQQSSHLVPSFPGATTSWHTMDPTRFFMAARPNQSQTQFNKYPHLNQAMVESTAAALIRGNTGSSSVPVLKTRQSPYTISPHSARGIHVPVATTTEEASPDTITTTQLHKKRPRSSGPPPPGGRIPTSIDKPWMVQRADGEMVYNGILDGNKDDVDYLPSCFPRRWVDNSHNGRMLVDFLYCPLRHYKWHNGPCQLYSAYNAKERVTVWRHELPCRDASWFRPIRFNLRGKLSFENKQPFPTFFLLLRNHAAKCEICASDDPVAKAAEAMAAKNKRHLMSRSRNRKLNEDEDGGEDEGEEGNDDDDAVVGSIDAVQQDTDDKSHFSLQEQRSPAPSGSSGGGGGDNDDNDDDAGTTT